MCYFIAFLTRNKYIIYFTCPLSLVPDRPKQVLLGDDEAEKICWQ